MFQARVNADFPQEAIRQAGIGAQVGQHHFHGFDAIAKEIADAVDLAHASLPKDAHNFVIAYGFARLESHDLTPE